MKKTILILIFLLIIITFYRWNENNKKERINNKTKSQTVDSSNTTIPTITIIASNLDTPWSLVFLPDKSILVTERKGDIVQIKGKEKKVLITLSEVKERGEGGLLGMALHPEFSKNHYIYLYYTYEDNGSNSLNRVVRIKFEKGTFGKQEIIVDKIPGSSNHNGGRIAFGPDNNLYITTGDAENPSHAQDTTSLAGKILRVTDKGKALPDNPFHNLVFSYGHRNPQGLAWDSQGRLWSTEHGPSFPQSGEDELNLIQKGGNYGWPIIKGTEKQKGMISPVLQSGTDTTWAPAGIVFSNGKLFFAGLKGKTIYKLDRSNMQVIPYLKDTYGRMREVKVGVDGFIYITTSNRDGRGQPSDEDDRILRIDPKSL